MTDLPIPGTTRPQRRAPEEPSWVSDARLSQVFLTDDGEERLYTVGALAEALGKKPVTIRKWIRLGVVPDASMRTGTIINGRFTAGRRLYSREQIDALVRIATSEGIIGDDKLRVKSFADTAFKMRVWGYWRTRNW